MKFILGTKGRMTQIFDTEGRVHPATVIVAGPMVVTKMKTVESDGYKAVQVGFGTKKEKNIGKSVKGQFKDLGNFRTLQEFRIKDDSSFTIGDKIAADTFKEGDTVTVSGVSKGKGFQGVVKRHKFKGGQRTHGQKHSEREPGTIGGGLRTRVPSGMRMAGRMGGDRVSVKNLTIVQVNAAENLILVRGAIPGKPGTLVEVVSK